MNVTTTLPILLSVVKISNINVTESEDAFQQLNQCAALYFEKYGSGTLADVPGVEIARKLFRMLGVEPTKHRPSSEALLRRALKQKSYYSINSLVDTCNWCALDQLLPNGIYDLAKIEGDITLREGREDEFYEGLANREIRLNGRYALVDQSGPFGSPISDSKHTATSLETTDALLITYALQDFSEDKLMKYAETAAERILAYNGGRVDEIKLIRST